VLAGRATFSNAIQFEPRNGETVARILDQEAGKYAFKLTLETAAARQVAGLAAGGVAPLQFEMQIGDLDYRYFQGTGTMEMWAPDYQAPASPSR
jgi:DNA-binding GntR family transcriptional regulator